ncbi:trimeric autotransporter adhesin, partial [Pseudomonas sp. OV226]
MVGAKSYALVSPNSVVLGNQNRSVNAPNSVAVGDGNNLTGDQSVVMGRSTSVTGDISMALGSNTSVIADHAISIGSNQVITANNSATIGQASVNSGVGSYALGNNNTIGANNAFVVGSNINVAPGLDSSIVLGNNSTVAAAVGTTGTSIYGGYHAFAGATPLAAMSVGAAGAERAITNVAAGRISGVSTDAVNGSQLSATNSSLTALANDSLLWDPTANGGNGAFSASHGGAGPNKITNVAPGDVSAGSTDAINGSQLFGLAGDTSNVYTDANGVGIRYARTNETGLPPLDAFAHGKGSTAVGYNAVSDGVSSLALGNNASATADNSVALGGGSKADGTTLGQQGYLVGGTASSEVNIGDRRITGVVAGATDTDAVNVAQLKAASTASVADAVMYDNSTHNNITLGGSTYDNTTHTGGTTITNVANGVADSDAVNMSQLNQTNSQVTNNTTNIQALANDALLWDPTANGGNGAFSASHGGAGPNKITNVAPGDVSAGSTDAINGSQLFGLAGDTSNVYTDANGVGIRYARTNETGLPPLDAFAHGKGSTAVGYNAVSDGVSSLALGNNASATADNSVALGGGSKADGTTLGQQGYLVGGTASSEVNIGDRRITGVVAGATDTDAVNVAQLKAASTASVADAVMYDNSTHNNITLGGSTYDNTTHTGGTTITNVANGVADSDAVNMSQLNQTNSQVTNNTTNIQALANDALLWDPTANGGNGAFSASHGGAGPNKITNVAPGDVSA